MTIVPTSEIAVRIKVGIINNDPNESGYRTANDKDLKAMFTEENGYEASFAYSLPHRANIRFSAPASLIFCTPVISA